jgi:DNA-binding NarL/FixJ family response regulator
VIRVVGVAENGVAAVELCRLERPAVVLMDLQMPEGDGITATRTIMAEGLGSDVLVLTSFSDGPRILAALDAGAVGYLLKGSDPDEVLDGIRAVSRGDSPLDPRAAREFLTSRATLPPPVQLTRRETEVLGLCATA